ncbi:hypothetical protein GGH95_005344, partial [Coemansia sp. RSA 1836]
MSVTEYLQQLDSEKALSVSCEIWAMVTARNALALSTVCAFVVASLALWSQPRRAALLKRTVDNVLEAGFGSGDGHSGKPLLPRFIRRLFHSHLPQFTLHGDRGGGSHALEKVDSEAAYQHSSSQRALCAGLEAAAAAPDTPPPPPPPLLPLSLPVVVCSGIDLAPDSDGPAVGQMQHVGGGAKRRHRRHRGIIDMRAATVAARPVAKHRHHHQRLKYRAMLMASRHDSSSSSSGVVAGSNETAKDAADEQVGKEAAESGFAHAPVADDDPVVDVTQPRRYRPAPIGQRSAGDIPPSPYYAVAAAAVNGGRFQSTTAMAETDDKHGWLPQIVGTDPEFSLFSSDFI